MLKSFRRSLCLSLAVVLVFVGFTTISAGASLKPKQAVANVTIGNPTSSIVNLPLWVAQANGYFAAQGLNVKVVSLTTATVITALVSGSVNFIGGSPSTLITARASGAPVEAIQATSEGSPYGFIVATAYATSHGITTKTPLATVAKDLIGSTGGSSSFLTTGVANLFLRGYGVQPSQVTVATFSSVAADEIALEKNQINWFVTAEPVPLQVQAQGFGIVVGSPLNVPAWSPRRAGISQLVMATTSSINTSPGLMRKMVRGLEAATTDIKKHELKVVSIAQANLPGVSRTIIFNSLRIIGWPTTGKMNGNLWRTTVAFATKTGAIAAGSKVVENVDWTNKFA